MATQELRIWNLPTKYSVHEILEFLGVSSIKREASNHIIIETSKSHADELLKKNCTIFKNQYIGVRFEDERKIRVWADGCFDLTHWGHLRVFMQGKQEGDVCLIGIHSDEDITRHKGPTLTPEKERYFCARACRWVDQVVEAAPYVTTLDTLEKYDCDFCVHGADITTDENGIDTYQAVKDAGKYREIERTDGVSTSEVINRMLAIAVPDFKYEKKQMSMHQLPKYNDLALNLPIDKKKRLPTEKDKIVYIDGSFDLLHSGTLKALREAKRLGAYLIVGVHDDDIVHEAHGEGFPILTIYERVFSVLACRYVDACIPKAPWKVTPEFCDKFNIKIVALGETHGPHVDRENPYASVKDRQEVFKSRSSQTVLGLCKSVAGNYEEFAARNLKKGEISDNQAQLITSSEIIPADPAALHSEENAL